MLEDRDNEIMRQDVKIKSLSERLTNTEEMVNKLSMNKQELKEEELRQEMIRKLERVEQKKLEEDYKKKIQ